MKKKTQVKAGQALVVLKSRGSGNGCDGYGYLDVY